MNPHTGQPAAAQDIAAEPRGSSGTRYHCQTALAAPSIYRGLNLAIAPLIFLLGWTRLDPAGLGGNQDWP
ncbi:MAG: hypothetical protein AMJ63_01765 [Myxococcales bacterium SG8_38_1]|nr:MAG: hypothetical protein AMJ63_01765 [Myxococcales bacterium SG8_38_1]